MKRSKFNVYRYCKGPRGWHYYKVPTSANGKLKPSLCIFEGREFEAGGKFYIPVRGQWVLVGDTAAEAQAARTKLLAKQNYEKATGEVLETPTREPNGIPLEEAAEKYFSNLVAQGKDPKTIRAYRVAVDGFVSQYKKQFVQQIDKQDVLDFMGWLRQQPLHERKHSNPERTYANKLGHLAIFLKAVGKPRLLAKNEYPQYEDKEVKAHSDRELAVLYSRANPVQRFLLDFALGTGFRDGEISHAEYQDLRDDNVIEVKRKPHLNWHPKKHHRREVKIPQALAEEIRMKGNSGLIFPNEEGRPDGHLLRKLQRLAKGGGFHTELHRLRKTWATRLALAGMPLHVLQKRLGHKSLVTTQRYLADVDLSKGEVDKYVEAATFVPKEPQTVREALVM